MLHGRLILLAMATTAIAGCSSDAAMSVAPDPNKVEVLTEAITRPTSGTALPRASEAGSAGSTDAAVQGNPHSALDDPEVIAKLQSLALQASASAGVSSPASMRAVAVADHQDAETYLSGATVYDHAPVYVVKIVGGRFTATRHPRGVPAPYGSVLTLTIDAATFRVTDIGYVDVEPDLSRLGSGEIDLPLK